MVDLDDDVGGREGWVGCTLNRFRSEALVDMSLKEVEGGCSMFVELLMLLFDGLIWTDNGGLGKLSMHLNEDVEDEVVADVTSSAMIDEGDDCDDFDHEKNELEFI